MDIMDRYNELKRHRDMHRNMSNVAVIPDVRSIHARHAHEFDVEIQALQMQVVKFIDGLGSV